MSTAAQVLGYVMLGMISIIGLRFLFYFHSFFFHWTRYRRRREVTDDEIAAVEELPFIKIQITTRGSLGTSEVMTRAIANVAALVRERRALYDRLISIEVVTENEGQKLELGDLFDRLRLDGHVIVIPKGYEARKGTQMKARGPHYMVGLRRSGFNRKPSQTFVVHYDEESVMEPSELRKLIHYVATTRTKVSEGPIHYPLEYTEVSPLCRAMEANRPIGCYECRAVMERGVPLHLHGSNLVIDEEFENDLGWDIGLLDGQPFVAEDYVFGVNAFIKEGPSAFGWHGSVMLEQPPFSVRSAFRQRYRWVFGVGASHGQPDARSPQAITADPLEPHLGYAVSGSYVRSWSSDGPGGVSLADLSRFGGYGRHHTRIAAISGDDVVNCLRVPLDQ
jgi:hypothetical protein